tara:strand:+ start:399 stop:1055 length:657 start_codon:yes stop_codon:yes gene_type:complete
MKKNEKGFTLVLSLVLLLAMSLMGGGLVVIASSDHQSNNSSDQFQQTFYVAEHALLEAEKRLIENMMGPAISSTERNEDIRGIPTNRENADSGLDQTTACYKSFRNLSRDTDFKVYEHVKEVSFYNVIEPILTNTTGLGNAKEIENEIKNLKKYHYEFFSVNAGSSTYKSAGMSLKKGSGTTQRTGSAYRIYGCGIMGNNAKKPEILIPLETIAIISH